MNRIKENRIRSAAVALAATLLPLIFSASVWAHEVQHDINLVQAMQVHLVYADGEPFSYENYELYADAGPRPVQTGRTDALGRVVFVSGQTQQWRLRAFSADGHGVDLKFPGMGDGGQATVALGQPASSRNTRLIFGLSIILGLFGVVQFFLKKKKSK